MALENEFAWRTRLMDFVLAERPIITNGGDPLGEDLIRRGIAYRADTSTIKETFIQVLRKPPTQSIYDQAAHDYSWNVLTEPLAQELKVATRMVQAEMDLNFEWKHALKAGVLLLARLPVIMVKSLRAHGLKGTIWRIGTKLKVIKR